MSEALILGLAVPISTMLTVIITAWIHAKANKKQAIAVKDDIKQTVEGYHKEVNGKMTQLLETTAALARERGKREGKAEGP